MISIPTVLVLGAGASKPFGFPIGRELVDVIIRETVDPTALQIGQTLSRCGFSEHEISDFGQALRFSQRNSVDAFLERRQKYLEIGKAAIAAALIPFETEERFQSGDWYRYLFNIMNTSFEEFDTNQLSVITFNYDRSLEQFLYTALRHSYGEGIPESAAKLRRIPIVHLHGQLGRLAELEENGQKYEPRVTGGIVQERSKQIKIIHETTDDHLLSDPQFKAAHRMLTGAKRVCFLGFGYDSTNLRRLLQPTNVLAGKWVVGSAMGFTDAEKGHIRKRVYGDLQLQHFSWGCLDTLRETGILFP